MMVAYACAMESRRYPTDLSDDEWRCISPHLPEPHGARSPQASWLEGDPRRRLLRTQERLPLAVVAEGLPAVEDRLRLVQEVAHRRDVGAPERPSCASSCGVRLGRDPNPSAAIVDSQSVKTTGVGGKERGFDPAKKVEGRKRHLWWTPRVWC